MKASFSTFQDISKACGKRSIVLFGAGNIARKTLRKLDQRPCFIVDNNPNLWGTQQYGLEVKSPEPLKAHGPSNVFVIICTTSFDDVSEQLIGMSFEPGRDCIVSPILNDLRVISDLESLEASLLFASGAPVQDSPLYGGGIYELHLDGEWRHEKVLEGSTHGLIRFEENFVATHDELGIIEFDSNYNLIRHREVPPASRPHGVAYSEMTQCFYVVASYMDTILVFSKDFDQVGTIPISDKYELEGDAQHHCNDVCVIGNSLYVSMFSYTGNWKRDIFDGVVLEIDIASKRIRGPVITDLWMPHNVLFISGSITVLDSLRGQLKKSNAQPIGEFPGFARGLAYDGVYYYVGQSRNRNYSRYLGLSKNISLDTSIIVFDEYTKVSRSLFLPSKLSEIHSILVL